MTRIRLHFLSGSLKGQSRGWPKGRISIGRSRGNDVVLPEQDYASASGHHVEVFFEDGWKIRDLDSTNGTYVNGEKLAPEQSVPLNRGDEISLGADAVFRAHLGGLAPFRLFVAVLLAALLVVGLVALRHLLRLERGFEPIGDRVTQSVYLLLAEDAHGRRVAGTGFAVRKDGWLATNAHVAQVLSELETSGAAAKAIRSDAPNEVHRVLRILTHPDYRAGGFRDDVALLRLSMDGASEMKPLSFAGRAELEQLSRGTRLGAVGFPAAHTDTSHPRARMNVDVIADRRDGFLGVGLGISPGMSGSPIFDYDGAVVGIVVGGEFADRVNWGLTSEPILELMTEIDR